MLTLIGLQTYECSVQFNELNTDCGHDDVGCEFIELVETKCDVFQTWHHAPSLYVAIIESVHVHDELQRPLIRVLINITGLDLTPGRS